MTCFFFTYVIEIKVHKNSLVPRARVSPISPQKEPIPIFSLMNLGFWEKRRRKFKISFSGKKSSLQKRERKRKRERDRKPTLSSTRSDSFDGYHHRFLSSSSTVFLNARPHQKRGRLVKKNLVESSSSQCRLQNRKSSKRTSRRLWKRSLGEREGRGIGR